MDRTALSKRIAGRMPVTQQQAREFVDVMLDIFEQELAENASLTLRDFGTFTIWQQTERPGRNPQNGIPAIIPARNSVKFKPGRGLLKTLNPSEED